MILRDYQLELAKKGELILKKYHLLYLALEMRVGKTLIAIHIASLIKAKRILFVTKKKAISDIYKQMLSLSGDDEYKFFLRITNYEALHKEQPEFDLVICDEAHSLGSYPKASKRAQELRRIVSGNSLKFADAYVIYLSGTPSPESYSQLYHQFWISRHSPFTQPSFYKWAEAGFVLVQEKRISGHTIRDYSCAIQKQVELYTKKLFISFTQEDAGFVAPRLEDKIVNVEIDPKIVQLAEKIIRDRIYTFKDGTVLVCDTAAKLQRKLHQIYSGTVIIDSNEDGSIRREHRILDRSKAEYIKEHWLGRKKIAVFYFFTGEGEVLKQTLVNWTEDPNHFNNTTEHVVYLGQFQSSSRGINLSSTDMIIFYNIHFSSELYQQARQRGQEQEKEKVTELVWLFSKNGMENKIYSRVINKQSYTLSYFRKDYL